MPDIKNDQQGFLLAGVCPNTLCCGVYYESSSMKIVLLQNIEAAIADDNTGELETLNELLTAKQKELVKLAQAQKDYSALADEVARLKEKKQKLLVAKANTERF